MGLLLLRTSPLLFYNVPLLESDPEMLGGLREIERLAFPVHVVVMAQTAVSSDLRADRFEGVVLSVFLSL